MKIQSLIKVTGLALAVSVASNAGLQAQDDVGPARDLTVPYTQNFDSIPLATVAEDKDTSLFDNDQWRVFGNAFSPDMSTYLYGYGPFKAPNNINGENGEVFTGTAFTTVASGDPTTSGDNYLNVFSDYNNGDHEIGNIINAVVYQDFSVTAADVGKTFSFDFDYRNATGGIADNVNGGTAGVFVKVLDQIGGGFGEIDREDFDTTGATDTFQAGSIEFEIKSTHVGQALQIGFETFASNYDPSGVFYDSLSFAEATDDVVGDFTGDGVVDCDDLDGYVGNIGATATGALALLDLDGNGTLSAADANTHITTLVQTSNGQVGTFPGDLNCDGTVNVLGDAFALISNLNNAATSYSEGDINFDGTVNVLGDAFALIGNLGNTNNP